MQMLSRKHCSPPIQRKTSESNAKHGGGISFSILLVEMDVLALVLGLAPKLSYF